MQAVIMCGGKGSRLRMVTNDTIPKSMVSVAGKPLLLRQVENLREQGIEEFVFAVGYLWNIIYDFFRDGSDFGVHIDYIIEETPLGSAGALYMLPPLLKSRKDFLLLSGDILFDIDIARMKKFHEEKKAFATQFIHPNDHPCDSDIIVCDNDMRIIRFDSKRNVRKYWYHSRVNAGLVLINPEACNYVKKNKQVNLEGDLLPALLKRGMPLYAYQSSEYVKDIGKPERLAAAEQDIRQGRVAKKNLKNKQRAIFLDRDGTINKQKGLICSEEQFELELYAAESLNRLHAAGFLAIVVTNQPVVARGLCDIAAVDNIHAKMETLLGREGAYLDAIYFCPHHPDSGYPGENPKYKIPCVCRKPATGMIEQAVSRFNIDVSDSWIVGDSTIDIQTGLNAGLHTALVLTGVGGKDGKYAVEPEIVGANLNDAIDRILMTRI